jgi:signal transduction histidine kinase
MIQDAQGDENTRNEDLEFLLQRCEEMGALFEKITAFAEKMSTASGEEAVLTREAFDRLTTNLTAKGQEMVNHAFLLIQESNKDIASVKRGSIVLVMVALLFIIGASILLSLLVGRRILIDLSLLEQGSEVVAQGNLDHRVEIRKEDEIGGLAKAFNEMTRRLDASAQEKENYSLKLAQSNRELEDFAFVASHDLQEPLRKIQTFGGRLKEKHGASLGEGGRDYVDRMQNAAIRMQDLLQDLLSYSRVTTRPEPFAPVALTSLVGEAVSDLTVRLEQTGGRVEVGDLPVVESSPSQIRQLFQNLLNNSLKYRSEKTPVIRVSAKPAPDPAGGKDPSGGRRVEILVEDNGIGFDEKYLDRIFQPFQRLHGRREYEGTGMGLAICRKIVERHGGTITARSAPDKGATFIITLPVKQETRKSPVS